MKREKQKRKKKMKLLFLLVGICFAQCASDYSNATYISTGSCTASIPGTPANWTLYLDEDDPQGISDPVYCPPGESITVSWGLKLNLDDVSVMDLYDAIVVISQEGDAFNGTDCQGFYWSGPQGPSQNALNPVNGPWAPSGSDDDACGDLVPADTQVVFAITEATIVCPETYADPVAGESLTFGVIVGGTGASNSNDCVDASNIGGLWDTCFEISSPPSVDVTPCQEIMVADDSKNGIVYNGKDKLIDVVANDFINSENQVDLSSLVIVTPPEKGNVTVNANGTITYINPREKIEDQPKGVKDSFVYEICNICGACANATVSIRASALSQGGAIGIGVGAGVLAIISIAASVILSRMTPSKTMSYQQMEG